MDRDRSEHPQACLPREKFESATGCSMQHRTPAAAMRTPLSTPNPTNKYELLYATVLSHWRRSHCETALVLQELRCVEAATDARGSRLGRVLVLCRASLQRRALQHWVIVSSQLSTGHEVQAATASLRRERAVVKETAARLAAAEEAELMTRNELEVALRAHSDRGESTAPHSRSMSVRAEQLLAAWRQAEAAT